MTSLPDAWADVLERKRSYAHLATVMPDGSPQVSPVWFDVDAGRIRVNSARGRRKDRNMRRDARVALSIQDPDDPERTIMIRGRVVAITEDGTGAHIDTLARKYLGRDRFPWAAPGEVRVIYVIEPERVSTDPR
jgi:PPOX class probable F420-dependent enzyme